MGAECRSVEAPMGGSISDRPWERLETRKTRKTNQGILMLKGA